VTRRVVVSILDDDGTPIVEDIDCEFAGGTWVQVEDTDTGAGQVTMSPAAEGADDLQPDTLVRFATQDGDDPAEPFATIKIREIDRTPVATSEGERTTVAAGVDWFAEFDDEVILPPFGYDSVPAATVIRSDWTNPDLAVDDWTTPVFLGAVFSGDLDPFGDPTGAPISSKDRSNVEGAADVFAGWIWSAALDGDGSRPGETSYFHIAVDLDAGPALWDWTADDYGQSALDGVVFDSGVTPPAVMWRDIRPNGVRNVTEGTHVFRFRCENDGRYGDPNPAAFMCTIYQELVSQFKELDNVVARTGENVASADPVLGGTWKCLHAPSSPPGMTWGHFYRRQFERTQADGGLDGWTLGFDDDEDSDGNEWPVTDQITAIVNGTHGAFFRASRDRGFAQVAARPGEQVLDAWVWGTRGDFHTSPPSPPAWDDTSASMVSATRRR